MFGNKRRRESPRRHQERTYINEDGSIERNNAGPGFSLTRCAILIAGMSWLIATNPANEVLISNTMSRWTTKKRKKATNSFGMRRTTNYGFFAVQERTIQVIVHAAGQQWNCAYDDPMVGELLCRDFLRDYLCHEQPLVWKSRDRVYTLHRILAWTILATTFFAACFRSNPVPPTGNILRNSFVSIFMDYRSQREPLQVLIEKLVDLNVYVYPALVAMDVLIRKRHPGSPFRRIDAPYDWFVALFLWFVLLILCNAATTLWSGGTPLLRFRTLTAAAAGYHAHYREVMPWSGNAPFYTAGSVVVGWPHVTVAALAATVWFHGLPAAVSWGMVYIVAGKSWAQWHYRS